MNRAVSFFEIPAVDFDRAVKFYEDLFGVKLEQMDCGREKMAFFPAEDGLSPGAISWSSAFDFGPSAQGVLVSLNCKSITDSEKTIERGGGKILIPKTKIESDSRGYFCVFLDSEGNRVGLYCDK